VAGLELSQAFERVSQRVIAEQLCELDGALGLNVTQLVVAKFRMLSTTDEDGEESFLNVSTPDVTQLRPPLSLAASASANGGDVFDVEGYRVVDPSDNISANEGPGNGSLSSNQASETTV
jgi:hypothetical protein